MGALFARDLACYVRGLCAPVGRCRLSQQSNNNSACRYTVMLALGASAWEYQAQLLSVTTHAPRIFVTPAKHVFFFSSDITTKLLRKLFWTIAPEEGYFTPRLKLFDIQVYFVCETWQV